MIDISTPREKLLEQERLRPSPGQFSALWERGESWQQGRCEEAIQRFQAAFDANPTAHEAYEPLDNMAFCLYRRLAFATRRCITITA